MNECKPLAPTSMTVATIPVYTPESSFSADSRTTFRMSSKRSASAQGLTLVVHIRGARLEELQDTFMNLVGLHGGHKSS